MQLKYNRHQSLGTTFFKFIIKLILLILAVCVLIFLIEKINFPNPQQQFKIDITNDIKKLK